MRWNLLAVLSVMTLPGTGLAEELAASFQEKVAPVLARHCTACHSGMKPRARVSLETPKTREAFLADRRLWFRVLSQVEAGKMPPAGETPLTEAERRAIVGWVRGEYADTARAEQTRLGRSRFRRLSRNEYANTMEDLFGIRPRVDLHLPDDGRVDGYDRLSESLPLSTEGALAYHTMAEELLSRWILRPLPQKYDPTLAGRTIRAEAMESGQSPGHSLRLPDDTIVSFNSDTTSGRLKYPGARVAGIHRIRVSVYGYQTDRPLPFGIFVGNTNAYPQVLELAGVLEAPPGKAAVLETDIYLREKSGVRLIPFNIGVQVPKNTQASACKGPGLAVQWLEDVTPDLPIPGDRWLTADFPEALEQELRQPRPVFLHAAAAKNTAAKSVTREQFLAVMRTTFSRVGARLFRRDLTAGELDAALTDIARRLEAGTALRSVFVDTVAQLLTAPEFLCVIEQPGPLTDFALASRLAYFLWNSTPDDALMTAARQGKLRDPQGLKEQTERLLKDPRSSRFTSDFVDQWLGLRGIDDTTPDPKLFPEYARDELWKPSSVWETRAFWHALWTENRSVREIADARWVLANESLAKVYGLPDVRGIAIRKVPLPETSPYGGLLTQSAILKVTANGTNTSPVKRGVWVAERLLGTPIPPPPADINPVEPDIRGAQTLREQLARHSQSSTCAACHARFDPYGFALESFDVTGQFRTHYRVAEPGMKQTWRNGLPVDASGTTPDGTAFTGVVDLRRWLAKKPEALANGLARHLVTYATGAPVTWIDQPAIDRVVQSTAGGDYGVRSLVHAVVQSELFRHK